MITKEKLHEIRLAHYAIQQCQDSSVMMFDLINRFTKLFGYMPEILDELERLNKLDEEAKPGTISGSLERFERTGM